jgi:hypothetical protein
MLHLLRHIFRNRSFEFGGTGGGFEVKWEIYNMNAKLILNFMIELC